MPFTPRALQAKLAALYVGLSPTTFFQVVAPEVPAVRLSPSRIAWLREDLDAWLDRRKAPTVDAPAPSGNAAAPEATNGRSFVAAGLAHGAAQRRARRPHKAG